MNKRNAFMLGSLLLVTGAASAQSNVVVYGSVDAGISAVNDEGGAHITKVDAGNRSPDRIGFRGTEDLGNGLRAVFQLENGFNVDDGNMKRSGGLFNRVSFVGLAGSAGTLTFGHMPDFMYDYLRVTGNGFLKSLYFFHPGNLDNQANQFQIDNAIKYESPVIHGFTLGVMNGMGEQPDSFNKNRSYSVGLRYAGNGLSGSAAYTVSNNRSLNLGAGLGIASLLGQQLSSNLGTPNAKYTNFTADQVRSTGISAAYKVGNVTPHAMYTQVELRARGGAATMRTAELGADIVTGGSNTFGASLGSSRLEQSRWNQFNLVDTIQLSVRTAVYAAAAFQHASGAHAVINGTAPASGQSQRVLRIGVNHTF